MNAIPHKRELLSKLLSGEIPPAQVAVYLSGQSFWAVEEAPDVFAVEIRRHGLPAENQTMTRAEIDRLKPMCIGWIVTGLNSEWIHVGNRHLYPYSDRPINVTLNID